MTKKSLGRQRRDQLAAQAAEEGVGQTWDKLAELHASHVGLFAQYAEMAAMIESPEVRPWLTNEAATTNLMKGLASDVAYLKAETDKLYAKHGNRTGEVSNSEEDWFTVTMLHQEYMMLMAHHQQTCLPIMLQLDEHLQQALRNRQQKEIEAVEKAAAQLGETAVAPAEAEQPVTN